MLLRDFIIESNRIEGILKLPTEEEINAYKTFLDTQEMRVGDLCRLVSVIQPNAKLRIRPGMDVMVGGYIPPYGGMAVVYALKEILQTQQSPYKQHLQYETLHPFTDGNGRSGRALWLWRHGGTTDLGFLHSFYYETLKEQ